MNKATNSTDNKTNKKHGEAVFYAIGFLLSVVFTLVPYYLVVNNSISSISLSTLILGFAVLQMIIQIFFFLHLGRGPKPLYNVVFFVATVGIILVVISGSIFIINHLHYNMTPSEVTTNLAESEGISQVDGKKTGACQSVHANHQVIITSSSVSPLHTRAQLCDTLTFISQDKILHDIAFGSHPEHENYAGESELQVKKGKNNTITLNQAGSYQFHDHLNPALAGYFTVAQ